MTAVDTGFGNPDYVPQAADFAAFNPTPAKTVGLPPADFINRITHLQNSGQQWLPTQTLVALASSGLSDGEIVQTAEQMRKAATSSVQSSLLKPGIAAAQKTLDVAQQGLTSAQQYTTGPSAGAGGVGAQQQLNRQQQTVNAAKAKATNPDDGFKVLFDDPVLQKHPSAALALKQYLSGAVGPWPLADVHLGHIQQQLQVQGYGRDLKADGAWNPGWDAAQQQWKDNLFKAQLAGNKPGSLTVGHALSALQALTPTSAWNSLIGFVKQLPDGARNLMADVAGSTAGLGYSIIHPSEFTRGSGGSAGHEAAHGEAAAAVQNLFGMDTTPQAEVKDFETHFARHLIEDASNIIMLTSALGSAGRFADAIGEGAASLGTEAAYRGPGVIANSLSSATAGNPLLPRIAAGGLLGAGGTAVAGGSPAQIALGGLAGGAVGGLSTTNVFQNLPILGRTGPIIDSLADADGLYYKARRLVAAPYQLKAVQAADTAFNSSLMLGAEARGLGQINQYVDPNSGFSKATQDTHTLDTVNDALRNRLQFTALGAHIAPSLDDLMFVFSGHGATALKNAPSAQFGAGVTKSLDTYKDFLGRTGVESAIENATGLSRRQLIKNSGGLENYTNFWTSQVLQHAIAHTVEDARNRDLLAGGFPAEEGAADLSRLQDIQNRTHQTWQDIQADPTVAKNAVEQLVAQGGGNELFRRIQRDITNGFIKPNTPGHVQQYMDAVNTAKREMIPHVGAHIPEADVSEIPINHVLQNAGTEPGQLGIARADTLTRTPAQAKAADMQNEIDSFNVRASYNPNADQALQEQLPGIAPTVTHPSFEEQAALQRKVGDALHEDFGVTASHMPQDLQGKIDAYKNFAGQLAVEVRAHPDAPQAVLDAEQHINSLGYKLVSGTDIGHHLLPSPVSDILTNPLSFQRRVAQHLGITPEIVDQKVISSTQWDNMRRGIQTGIDKGTITLPPWETPDSILAYLNADGVLNQTNPLKRGLRELFSTPQKLAEKENAANPGGYLNEMGQLDVGRARAELDGAYQIRDATAKDLRGALTDRERWAAQHPASAAVHDALNDVPPMSDQSAEGITNAVRNGYAAPPAWQLGATKLEDMFRASMGFAGKGVQYRVPVGAAVGAGVGYAAGGDLKSAGEGAAAGGVVAALGGDKLGYAMANLPNALIRVRNEMRFELSPMFSFRRVAKTNVKMGLEGVTPVLSPLDTMINAGTVNQDRAILEQIRPASAAETITDDADKYIKSQDLFGFYNPRNYEAYAAGQLARQGKSPDEISQALTKIFEYGSSTERGRSALERSSNFVFFPFSFDKTLYRNLGGYLLDNPAQRLLLTRGMAAYDAFNRNHMDGSNPLATSFYDKHLPLLTEASQLNAFAGGISPGQPGGINRPLLNLFLPQSWGASPDALGTLKKFAPMVKDFSRIYAEAGDQVDIAGATFNNLARDINTGSMSGGATYGDPGASTLTQQAQLTNGFAMDRNWKQALATYTDYNAQAANTDKYKFPLEPQWGKYAGEPITNANIRELVHLKYPAYDPSGAIKFVTDQNRQFQQYVLDKKGTPLHDYIVNFQKTANQLGTLMNKGNVSNSDVVAQTDALRQAAAYIANKDSTFYSLYNRNFRKIIGPLEAVKNG